MTDDLLVKKKKIDSSVKPKKNYYEMLKVLPNASYETLWIAFETLMKDLKFPAPETRDADSTPPAEKENLLREAIMILSDPDTRKVYDRTMGLHGIPDRSADGTTGKKKSEPTTDPYEEAVGRLVSGDLEGALEAFLCLFRSEGAETRVIEMIGLCHRLAGRPAEAIPFYRMAIAAEPGNIGNHVYLAELHMEIDDEDKAEKILEDAIEIGEDIRDEGNATADDLMALGDAYYLLGESEAAADILTEALEGLTVEEDRLEILERLAEVYYEAGYLRDCLDTCGRALDINPNSAEAHLILGLTHFNCNLLASASGHLRRSLAIDRGQDEIKPLLEEIAHARAEAGGKTLEEKIFLSRARKRHLGMVKWFDDQEGTGAISRPGAGPVVLHYLSMLGEPDMISEGDPVSFGILNHRGEKVAVSVRKENPQTFGVYSFETASRLLGKVADPAGGNGYTEIEFESGKAVLLHSGVNTDLVAKLRPGVLVEFTPIHADGDDGDGPLLAANPVIKE